MAKRVIQYSETASKWIVRKLPGVPLWKTTHLVVKMGQIVVLTYNGIVKDVYGPGGYILKPPSIPGLGYLTHALGIGDKAPIIDIYYINSTIFLNNGWGTKDPIIRKDKELDIVRLTAFGNYSFRIKDAKTFVEEVAGSRLVAADTPQTIAYISNMVSQYIAVSLSESNFSIIDIGAHYKDIAEIILADANRHLDGLGIQLTDLIVENVGVTSKVGKSIDEYSAMNLAKRDFDSYERYQRSKSMREAASVPGNAIAMELGAVMGKQIARIADIKDE